jgi:hypothetical protein
MLKHASLFSQLLSLFERPAFQKVVCEHRAERYSKGFSSWDHFASMLFCQLAQAKSLREICGGLACCLGKLVHLGFKGAPNKSTLSYANAHRPWQMYRDIFYQLLEKCRILAPGKKFRFHNKLLSLDATVIDLCLSLFEWAEFRTTKGAVKLHLLLDHDGYLPVFAHITVGKVHELRVARTLSLPAGSIVALDRAFTDYGLFNKWCDEGVYFVTRMKLGADFEIVEHREPPQGRNIFMDNIVRLTGVAGRKCPHLLRHVVVYDPEKDDHIVLLTNHLGFGASTISAIYKDRWQIEIFFKTLKQNLKIKTFVGTSENALKIQIWTALIAMLLIKYLQFISKLSWSLSNLVALLRWNLFTYRNLWEWIDDPFGTPPIEPESEQLSLDFAPFGQHMVIR